MQYKVFGCKVNKYYTDRWLNSEYLADKTGTFVASCVVTDNAKRKWVRFVKKELQTLEKNQKIYISGCGAFKDGKAQSDFFEIYPELAGNQNKIEVLDEAPDINLTPILSLKKREKPQQEAGATSLHHLFGKSSGETGLSGQAQQGHNHSTQEVNSSLRSEGHKKNPPLSEHISVPLSKGEGAKRKGDGKIDFSKLEKLKKTQIYTRKNILIQGGCDSFCTFCLTVIKRGRHFYRSPEDIVEEILEFENVGGKEIVLTGVNLSAWGLDNTHSIENFSKDIIKNNVHGGNKSRFAELLKYILEHTKIPRIRISSLGPEFITDEVLEIFANERIYPHFHYSIQSGSSKVLKEMARHYDGNYMRKLLEKTLAVKRKDSVDISIGADIIVGFPGESDEDFEDTFDLVKNYNITKLHAFPFSAHTLGESVPAGSFKNQVEESAKKERMNRLLEVGEHNRENFVASQKGKTLKVLIEKYSSSVIPADAGISQDQKTLLQDNRFLHPQEGHKIIKFSGWSENYIECNEDNFEVITGKIERNSIVFGKLL